MIHSHAKAPFSHSIVFTYSKTKPASKLQSDTPTRGYLMDKVQPYKAWGRIEIHSFAPQAKTLFPRFESMISKSHNSDHNVVPCLTL